jgi:uncharacterized protein
MDCTRGGSGRKGNGTAQGTLVLRLHDDPTRVDAQRWNALLAASPEPTPFLRHEFLCALHASGSASPDTGWAPLFVVLEDGEDWIAACALYLKSHSYGEYVFDWAWAEAYERAGLRYYPKLLGAVPFTPVPGSRILARTDAARSAMFDALRALTKEQKLSSAHLLFIDERERECAAAAGWMLRSTVQFHWHNRAGEPYASFDDFLACLNHDKRKKIRQERRHVRDAGVQFEARQGAQITEADWDFFYRCYQLTYRAHRSTPYLTRGFFAQVAQSLPEHWLMFIARAASGEPVASSLIALDPEHRVAFGRYWGCTAYVPHLHFEACYYQPLQWCIAHGWSRFEGGAQGEHKMSRGLMPVRTWSAHWLRDARFADAVARFLEREGPGVGAYVDELREHSPFRQTGRNEPIP